MDAIERAAANLKGRGFKKQEGNAEVLLPGSAQVWTRTDEDPFVCSITPEGKIRAHRFMEPETAREMIRHYGEAHTVIVRFQKKNGDVRRMVCRNYEQKSMHRDYLTVWDMEAGASRQVNVTTVISVDVPRKKSSQFDGMTMQQAQQKMNEMFDPKQ